MIYQVGKLAVLPKTTNTSTKSSELQVVYNKNYDVISGIIFDRYTRIILFIY